MSGSLMHLLIAVCTLVLAGGCPASGDEEPPQSGSEVQAEAGSGKQPLRLTVKEAAQEEPAQEAEPFMPPEWVLAFPPKYALFPGNGDVVTLGQLDSLARSAAGNPVEEAEFGRWYIYDGEGKLLDGLPDGIHWWERYDIEWTERTRDYFEEGIYSSEYAGYTLYYQGEFDVLEVYDYDGTLMPEDFDPFTADKERMHGMSGEELLALAVSRD